MDKTQFLEEQKILRLATATRNGTPHIVPVWYLYESEKIYIGTNTRTKKAKNLRNNDKVAFCVDSGVHSPIYGLMGHGRAKLILKEKLVKEIAKKILLRYFQKITESAQELLDDTDCIIEIKPQKISTWNY